MRPKAVRSNESYKNISTPQGVKRLSPGFGREDQTRKKESKGAGQPGQEDMSCFDSFIPSGIVYIKIVCMNQ